MTYEQLLKVSSTKAFEHDMEAEAVKLLLLELSGFTPTEFYLNVKKDVPKDFIEFFNEKLALYLIDKVPVQHILGFSYFFGRKFKVNNNTLIPRAETEQLVEHVLMAYDDLFSNKSVDVVDLGTGSGCIAITLKLEEDLMNMRAYDISIDALEVAKENSEILGANVRFGVSNWFSAIDSKFDIIVANPPYIPKTEVVENIVQKEPSVALYGGEEGLDYYIEILKNAPKFLKEKAFIAFEHGYQQRQAIYNIAKRYFPDAKIVQLEDLAGKDRFTFVYIGREK